MHAWGKMKLALITGAVALLAAGCASHAMSHGNGPEPASAPEEPALGVVRALIEAFNRHDPEAMAALVTEDFEYLSVNGAQVSVDATGREALRKSMVGYFASTREVHSTLEAATVTGPYVAFRERVSWRGKSGPRSQASLGVYEVHQGLVRRAWYFPAVEPSGAPPSP